MNEAQEVKSDETPKPERSIEELNKEYTQICSVIGEKSFKVEVMKSEIDSLHRKAFALDQEARELNAKIAKAVTEPQQ